MMNTLNVYVFQRSQIQFQFKGHAVIHKFSMSNNYMSSLRTTTCDALFVPSEKSYIIFVNPRNTGYMDWLPLYNPINY